MSGSTNSRHAVLAVSCAAALAGGIVGYELKGGESQPVTPADTKELTVDNNTYFVPLDEGNVENDRALFACDVPSYILLGRADRASGDNPTHHDVFSAEAAEQIIRKNAYSLSDSSVDELYSAANSATDKYLKARLLRAFRLRIADNAMTYADFTKVQKSPGEIRQSIADSDKALEYLPNGMKKDAVEKRQILFARAALSINRNGFFDIHKKKPHPTAESKVASTILEASITDPELQSKVSEINEAIDNNTPDAQKRYRSFQLGTIERAHIASMKSATQYKQNWKQVYRSGSRDFLNICEK